MVCTGFSSVDYGFSVGIYSLACVWVLIILLMEVCCAGHFSFESNFLFRFYLYILSSETWVVLVKHLCVQSSEVWAA